MFRLLPRLLPVFLIFVFAIFLVSSTLNSPLLKDIPKTNAEIASCCRVEDVLGSHGNFDPSAHTAIYDNKPVFYPQQILSQIAQDGSGTSDVLGASASAQTNQKWIDVSLSKQLVTAYQGNTVIRQFKISSGRWSPTPVGTFFIWYKTRFQRMVGGSKAEGTYYNLPNVPYNMFFYQGYALHGAYWHYNFGYPMSHGCVNEPLADAKWMFNWAGPKIPEGQNWVSASKDNPGTKVVIHQ